MIYSFHVSTHFDEVERSRPKLLHFFFFITLCQRLSRHTSSSFFFFFSRVFILLCKHEVVRFTSLEKKRKSQSFLYSENLWFSMFSITVEFCGNNSRYSTNPALSHGSATPPPPPHNSLFGNLMSFQTCTSIHNMHVLGFQKDTKGKKRQDRERNAPEYTRPTLEG